MKSKMIRKIAREYVTMRSNHACSKMKEDAKGMSSHGCRTKCDDLTPDVIVLWFVPRIILQSKHNLYERSRPYRACSL
jgi:hypothetical protein